MVKAHLAILLIGLVANQAFTSDDNRDQHWAEGVYFPPVTTPSTVQSNPHPVMPSRVQKIRRNPWPGGGNSHSTNPHTTLQSLGYPVDGYDPYWPSDGGVHESLPSHGDEYVPEDYLPNSPRQYNVNQDVNEYRVNDFGIAEDHSRDVYRARNYGYGTGRYRDHWQDGAYRRANESFESDYRGKNYAHRYGLGSHGKLDSTNHLPSHERQKYDSVSSNVPYYAAWKAEHFVDESGALQIPWELMWSMPISELPLYPLW